jgi:hypothetical protein
MSPQMKEWKTYLQHRLMINNLQSI